MTGKKERGQDIARRDFLQGAAITVTMGSLAPELAKAAGAEKAAQDAPNYYPPTLTGMRGSHPGAFEAAHEVRDGDFWNNATTLVDTHERYDLVVVGGGISGLSAAWFYRQKHPNARVLIIENHDDFGGHAKRNEFNVDGRVLLAKGGTQDMDSPYPYSKPASGLMTALGIDPVKLHKECSDPAIYKGLTTGVFFDKETFGTDKIVRVDTGEGDRGEPPPEAWIKFANEAPVSDAVKQSIIKIETGKENYYPGLTSDQIKEKFVRLSYKDYLLNVVKADPGIVPLYQHRTDDEWALGFEAVSALDAWGYGMSGFAGLPLKPGGKFQKFMGYTAAGYSTTEGSDFFHFPDGNASIARALVRKLVPGSIPGKDIHDLIMAKCDYAKLDRSSNAVRIRLNNLVVRARNVGKGVEVAYSASAGGGKVYKVAAKDCVMAGWNMFIPYIVPDMPDAQKAALHALVKSPLVYCNVALKNWKAFHSAGVERVMVPSGYFSMFNLSQPVNIGAYRMPRTPDEPMVIRMLRTPGAEGMSEDDQARMGRMDILQTTFDTFETNARAELDRVLGPHGFDAGNDIAGIMVNRWPHGYAPEYNGLWHTDYNANNGPNHAARQRFGRITVANSDSGYGAYTDVAIDEAWRAVNELPA
ncbi:MAG TPA: FAD-dependent oxidoreductase [Rhizomicrobium sp.]|nr:FAD-dependent oxidoreductase [Rhizomicrobium sp.]